jgi:chemotaxis protein methyltransferase CheR
MALDEPQSLSDAEFRIFTDLVRQRSGLHFDETTRFIVEKRLLRHMRESEAGSVSSYLLQLRNGPHAEDEMAAVIDLLTTNETYFFRERSQLDALVQEIIPTLLAQRSRAGKPVSIWSAGCSSGEEPFSIVMLAREAGLRPGRDFRVYASDISRRVLAKARRGVYREASFRETSESLRSRYFEEKDGWMRVSDEVKRDVDFLHMNLLDPAKVAMLGSIDVILCRNVIIYFDASAKKRLIGSFYETLEPGGHLLLGHAESLINITSNFELKHLERDLVYRRPLPGEERDDPWHALARRGVAEIEGQGALDD